MRNTHLSDRGPPHPLALLDGLSLKELNFLLQRFIVLFSLSQLTLELCKLLLHTVALVMLNPRDLILEAGPDVTPSAEPILCITQRLERGAGRVKLLGERCGERALNVVHPGKTVSHCVARGRSVQLRRNARRSTTLTILEILMLILSPHVQLLAVCMRIA